LFGRLALSPGLGAREFIRFGFAVGIVPGVEKLAGISALRSLFRRSTVEALRSDGGFLFRL
jgi:hypothetical protein